MWGLPLAVPAKVHKISRFEEVFVGARPEVLSSSKVRAGHRTYFLDLKKYAESGLCLSISESKRIEDHDFERHRILISEEYVLHFFQALKGLLEEADLLDASREVDSQRLGEDGRTVDTRKFSTIRADFPNAYKPWAPADDEQLRNAFQNCKEISVLADTFMRKPGAIQSRLRKLGLIS